MVLLPAALAFDVFGTVVDWRTSIARESAPFLAAVARPDLDPPTFADQWRARYLPAMAAVRDGRRPFVVLDTLHREMLVDLLAHHDIDTEALDPALIDDWSHAWRRLDPWPDAVEGLARLKRKFPIVTLSNGNVALNAVHSGRSRASIVIACSSPSPKVSSNSRSGAAGAPVARPVIRPHRSCSPPTRSIGTCSLT